MGEICRHMTEEVKEKEVGVTYKYKVEVVKEMVVVEICMYIMELIWGRGVSVLHDVGCIVIVDILYALEVVEICMYIMELIWGKGVSILHDVGCIVIVDTLHTLEVVGICMYIMELI